MTRRSMMRGAGRRPLATLAFGLAAALAHAPACRGDEPCPSAETVGEPEQKLDRLGAAIRQGGPIRILAIGGPAPPGAEGPPPASFPARFADALRAALPKVEVQLQAVGGRGLSAADAAPLLAASLAERRADLVLWQTGTVEAVKSVPPDEFSDALSEAAAKITEAGADLVLVDPQYSRFLRANADVEPYEEVLRAAAALPSVLLFRRFDLMHEWADDEQIDVERASKAEREGAVRRLHQCLGLALSDYVLKAAAGPAPDDGGAPDARQ